MTFIEKQKIERQLRMEGGYVLDFSNRTFEEFFREVLNVEIYSAKFSAGSGSKACRMRAFWKMASNEQLMLLFKGLLDGWEVYSKKPISDSERILLEQIIADLGGSTVANRESRTNQPGSPNPQTLDLLISRLIEITSLPPQRRG